MNLLTRPESHFALYDALRGGVDAIVSPAPPEAGFARQPLGSVPLQAHVAAEHRSARAGRAGVGLAELLAEPLVLPSSSAVSRRVLDEAVARCDLAYGPVEECDDGGTAQAIAASGKGVAVVTDNPRHGARAVPVLSDAGDPDSGLGVPLHVAWEYQHYAAPIISVLAQRLAAFRHAGRAVAGPDPHERLAAVM